MDLQPAPMPMWVQRNRAFAAAKERPSRSGVQSVLPARREDVEATGKMTEENLLIKALLRKSGAIWHARYMPELKAALRDASKEHREEFVRMAVEMPYSEYLKTVYWGVIRGWVLTARGDRCEFCRSKSRRLQVHHRDYRFRGEEFNHPEDLQVLCGLCHMDRHGLTSPEEANRAQLRRATAWLRVEKTTDNELDDLRAALRRSTAA